MNHVHPCAFDHLPFAALRDAYIELARRKARGKIVLALDATIVEPLKLDSAGNKQLARGGVFEVWNKRAYA